MDMTSDGGGGLSPEDAARTAERYVEGGGDREELDREREAARIEVFRLYEAALTAARSLSLGIQEYDDHRCVEGLRRLLAVGLLAKPLADRIERSLPQPTRLFAP